MSPHHQLRSRVVHRRFAAIAAIANVIVLVGAGFTPKDTAATATFPYVAALNGIFLIAGIIITIARRNIHRNPLNGVLFDLLFAIIVPIGLLMITGGGIMLMKPDVH